MENDLPTTHYDQKPEQKEVKQEEVKPTKKPGKYSYEKISIYILIASVFLAPLAFFPSIYAPLDVVKMVVLTLTIIISAVFYAVSTLKTRAVSLPRHPLAIISVLIMISLTISAFLSTNPIKSFIGQGFEIGTASFIFLMFLAMYLTSRMVAKDKEVALKVYTALLISTGILVILHIVRIFGGANILSLGFLSSSTSTLVGKWYDLAGLLAVTGLISFFGLKFFEVSKKIKRILIATLVVSGVSIFVINFTFVWYGLIFVFVSVGIYEFFTRTPKGTGVKAIASRISIFTFILLLVSIVSAWRLDVNGNTLASPVASHFGVEYGEAVLPWQLTLDVTTDTLKESPLFGAGPNRFSTQYLRFKPLEVNQTTLWNSDFPSGFGTLPTFVATEGIIGSILWCLFFIFFVRKGIRELRRKSTDKLKSFLVISSFFSATFLWVINIIYIPSHAIIFLAFVFTGIFIATATGDVSSKKSEYTAELVLFKEGSKYRKFAPVVTTLAIVVLLVWLGVYLKKSIAVAYFQKGIKVLNVDKSVDLAQADFKKALLWDNSDIYYQALSEVDILKINTLTQDLQSASTANPSAPLDQTKVQQIITLTNEAVNYTKSAERIDPFNHYNYLAEARISEIAATLKIPNAYENAKASYLNALRVNPYNPGIYLSLAQLEASQNKYTDAEQYIGRALQLKQNYTEAVYLLSQIQVANNQLSDAITSARVATQITPTDPTLFFELGFLQYNNKDYVDAVTALEQAVKLNSQYANAKYFLGLSYARLGRNDDAVTQFTDLSKTNPDNQEVVFILTNLKAGKSPFTDAKPPIDNKPEKRKTLPVTEKVTTTPDNADAQVTAPNTSTATVPAKTTKAPVTTTP